MRFALVNGIRTEPKKNIRGICQCCGSEVIPKCGRFKVHHWAHKEKSACDPWWENESEWHRKWKSAFPESWQERLFKDPETQEKHIADIYSESKDVAIEFQSYQLKPDELLSREKFYKKLVWVVHGNKNESDRIYFGMSLHKPQTSDPSLYKISWFGRSKLFERWAYCKKKVYIDFGDDVLWHLIEYNPSTKIGFLRTYKKSKFIQFFGGVASAG
ncbi:competence protein CoiA [Ideonella livida]|uniref:Competence protein CoiA-like N-terminal domain-containing protein n=1 Tax=Ideonella livida TaxID=2707176 RepID=A0A7C9TLG3_9BURK|nr:competence protein CoiA family protein [Ideonella livida]NDY92444.1 hypothetical protein [Ideonella livida]